MMSTRFISLSTATATRNLMSLSKSKSFPKFVPTYLRRSPSSFPSTAQSKLYEYSSVQLSIRNLSGKAVKEAMKNQSTKATDVATSQKVEQTFIQRWMAHKEIPPRGTLKWYGEMVLLCTVFAITGTSTMVLVRPAVSDVLGLQGSLKDGPWSYRICSIVIMTPLYSAMLVFVGTVFGRHHYFRHFAVKMFSRFGIRKFLSFCI